jgi:hypothetical protein
MRVVFLRNTIALHKYGTHSHSARRSSCAAITGRISSHGFPYYMSPARICTITLALAVSLFAIGCDDPSNVGLDVIGDVGGDPIIEDFAPEIGLAASRDEVTGQNSRILVGQVNDPLLGTVRAHAYVDFGTLVGSANFREGTVASATLNLRRDYVFGDTLGTVDLRLYDMPEEWAAQGATSDTTLVAGDFIASYTVSVSDTIVSLPLPASWVAANDTTLRSDVFPTVFHGFHLEAQSGTAVVGYAAGQSSLRAVAGTDSVTFPQSRNLTTTERLSAPVESESYAVLQSTAGPIVALDYDLSSVAGEFALNRASLRIQDDSLAAFAARPANFQRTRPSALNLYFRTHDDNLLLIETTARQDNGDFHFRSSDLYFLVSQILRGQRQPGTFELRTPSNPNTLDYVLIRQGDESQPRLRLVLTPLLD